MPPLSSSLSTSPRLEVAGVVAAGAGEGVEKEVGAVGVEGVVGLLYLQMWKEDQLSETLP